MAFARTFSYTIYGLALPNYLIYFQHVAPGIIGLIIAAYSLAFIFGPLVALPVTKKFGIRNTVIFSNYISVISVGLQLLFFDPWILIILRAVDGFFVGFFWPNLQMEISNWQRSGPKNLTDKYFKTYANSWNTGILLGQVIGYFIIFFGEGNEFMGLIFSWIAMIIMIPISFRIEKPRVKLVYQNHQAYASNDNLKNSIESNRNLITEISSESGKKSTDVKFLLAFPALFYLMGTLIYAYLKNFYPFMYPLYLENAEIPSYWVYLITFGHQIVQMIFIAVWSTRNARSGFKAWWFGMGINILCAFWLSINAEVITLTIFFILNGMLSAFFYNFTSKIMLQYGNTTGSLKYATLYELYNGIGFGFSPFIAGLLSDTSLTLNFPVLLGILCVFALILGILSKHALKMKVEKKIERND